MSYLESGIPNRAPQYMRATGKLPYTLINDYMFKALLQKNQKVLKHLICSLLHLQQEDIRSVKVTNPILLGAVQTEDFDGKTFVLDINVLLNDQTLINLEMQVADYRNWPERSMVYLCRNFDRLQSGQDYMEIKPTIHIGFLDFTLFPEHPEFYATYMMMNVKNHHIFTDRITLSVVNLKHMELATQEDREWKIDYWASLFKATTWEELKMLAEQNPVMGDAAETIYELTADEAIREQCKAREKQIKEMNTLVRERELAERARDAAWQEKAAAIRQLEEKDQRIAQLQQELQRLKERQHMPIGSD
ncbi:MAG: Rpn family recombination-promoting nuclease/putative transposase [Lachnospiraceae bacterium]|jgi:predicted transposase/invertase (TIGR01784 family)|nr:Rpn family recombination-promoting nuclease/putative transposase [Lachnospiraceae bacterium]